jgi:hypothetical protein
MTGLKHYLGPFEAYGQGLMPDTWRWMWPQLAAWFGIEPVGFDGEPRPLQQQMANAGPVWAQIAAQHDLVEPDSGRLASW